ncbi:MAG: hypothetical protein GXP29_11425, partial [Planctomycetes bacterium]|nr:hypothetical protein [Planctomycetota bacterium]
MFRAKNIVITAVFVGLLSIATGCEEQKNRIVMLEESNQQLLDDLTATQDELSAMRSANDQCQNSLSSSRGRINGLNSQLSSARNSARSRPAAIQQPVVQQQQPQVPSGWTAVPGGAMIAIEGSVLFGSGKAKLRSGATKELSRIAGVLQSEYSNRDILIYGHTDNTPIKK